VFLLGGATLNTQDYETQVARLDARVIETVSNGVRRSGAVDSMPLESREAFLLNRDNNLVAAQEAR